LFRVSDNIYPMKRSEFNYPLAEELIAQYPLKQRHNSRLMCLNRSSGAIKDKKFTDFPELLQPGDLIIFNDSKVIPARLFGVKKSGGKLEILIERVITNQRVLAQIRASKSPKPGNQIVLDSGDVLMVDGRQDDLFTLIYNGNKTVFELMELYGHVPLPPYIKRGDEPDDRDRYQTVYARRPGAVAAPTAGLHFSDEILQKLGEYGINLGFVTLHVGAGTFQPVRTESIEDHVMHREWFEISDALCAQFEDTRDRGGRVIAVGTTVVRCLESAFDVESLRPMSGETDIFIYPGYRFAATDGLVTNFHLPESTLLMLICAFAGIENTFRAYAHAVSEKYRFFSYGDAMLIL
jgi:S-adenosylmethionine:tRNA ribosyltransferase-isomerase